MTRINAREAAVQLCYALVMSGDPPPVCLDNFFDMDHFSALRNEEDLFDLYSAAPDAVQLAYINDIVTGVADHLAELNDYIAKYSKGWQVYRISEPALAVLRVAMYETLYYPDVPAASAFNAAIDIVRNYEDETVVKFVNGILGSYSRGELAAL